MYYAGLGLSFDGRSYLLPVNARLERPDDIERESVPLDVAAAAVESAKHVRLVLTDACRLNPLLEVMQRRGMSQAAGHGIAPRPSPRPITIGYASRCEKPVPLREGQLDSYTAALVRHIATPGLELPWLMERVRDSVLRASQGRQDPVHLGTLADRALFVPAAGIIGEAVQPNPSGPMPGQVSPRP